MYNKIILCTGFELDQSIFTADSTAPGGPPLIRLPHGVPVFDLDDGYQC